jgi:hypothetical protein
MVVPFSVPLRVTLLANVRARTRSRAAFFCFPYIPPIHLIAGGNPFDPVWAGSRTLYNPEEHARFRYQYGPFDLPLKLTHGSTVTYMAMSDQPLTRPDVRYCV